MRQWRNAVRADKALRAFVALYQQYQATAPLHLDVASRNI